MIRVATIGAASSANKGAASMLQAVIDNLPSRFGECHLDVLTTHPQADRLQPPEARADIQVEIVPFTPLKLLLADFPLALVARLTRPLLPARLWCRTAALRALLRADVVIDVAGISFVDGRGVPTLVYNSLMTGTPLLLGRPTVKCSQAMGPFRGRLNRLLARIVLGRLSYVCPRGERTEAHVADLGLARTIPAADLAFAMELPRDAGEAVARRLPALGGGESWIAVMPSSVVDRYCQRTGLDYPALMAGLIDHLTSGGHRVVLVPHSAQQSTKPGRMNDRPVCRKIHSLLSMPESCTLVDESLPPTQLRALIAACHALVTSRFHAMISALATQTPVLVVGWSHKYAEVLAEFGLEDWAIDFGELSGGGIEEQIDRLLRESSAVRAAIGAHLPAVRQRAMANFDAIGRTLERSREAA